MWWGRFDSTDEIDHGIGQLRGRLDQVEALARDQVTHDDVRVANVTSNIRKTLIEVFGAGSPEYARHVNHEIWDGPQVSPMPDVQKQRAFQAGVPRTIAMLEGLIANLEERRRGLKGPGKRVDKTLENLDLHPRIAEASRHLLRDFHYSQAVFEGCKALVQMVKKKAGRPELDGSELLLKVFSPDKPVLVFNPMKTETEIGEQRGLMFLFAGMALALRNPRAHESVKDSAEEARDYLITISRLAHRLDRAVLVDGELHLWADYQGPNENEIECVGVEVWFTPVGGDHEGRPRKRYDATQLRSLLYRLKKLKCPAVDAALNASPDWIDLRVRCTLSWAGLAELELLPP